MELWGTSRLGWAMLIACCAVLWEGCNAVQVQDRTREQANQFLRSVGSSKGEGIRDERREQKFSYSAKVGDVNMEDFIQGLDRENTPRTGSEAERVFKYYDYEHVVIETEKLAKEYPDLVEVYDAQTKYGLPSPGQCGKSKCRQMIMKITNKKTLPDPERPHVFFSGELHGNERVGPTTMIEFSKLLLESYVNCDNPWLQRLVNTRTIIIMPATNALGYYRNSRTEGSVDPNRDFPIDKPKGDCMQTVAARAVNEVWQENLVQLALTYHGGMQSIAFEWGTVSNRRTDVSPDDNSQLALGSSMSAYAGAFNHEGRYPHGRLNDQVYPVTGGMEDWGYAGSWKSSGPCHKDGYSEERTKYDDNVLRAFNILIECSEAKTPKETTLGSARQVIRPEGEGDGHVPRNMRLALLITDLVKPYVQWVEWNRQQNAFAWEVGGALYVDETFLEYVYLLNGEEHTNKTESLKGKTRWTGGGIFTGNNEINQKAKNGQDIYLDQQNNIHDRELWPYIPAFRASVPELPVGATLVSVVAKAMVDQSWKEQPRTPHPNLPPQSHVVNARINPSYKAEHAGFVVKGQLYWESERVDLRSTGLDPASTDDSAATSPPPPKDVDSDSTGSSTSSPTSSPTCTKRKPNVENVGKSLTTAGMIYEFFLFVVLVLGLFYGFKLYRKSTDRTMRYEPI